MENLTPNHLAYWMHTNLNPKVIDAFIEDLKPVEDHFLAQAEVNNYGDQEVNLSVRDSKVCFLPSGHWMSGFVWHYVQRANRENFNCDIDGFDEELIQFTSYGEGHFYDWHTDTGQPPVNIQKCRKLSFSLQLSHADEYEGGDLQFLNPNRKETFFAPKERGTLIIFDSRISHRVRKVKSGVRKSLVGWVVGPRWR
jgi:Rps23 Pro-64 3,4-dihydroxylase Tpa1-like proline 4-hydroxylase